MRIERGVRSLDLEADAGIHLAELGETRNEHLVGERRIRADAQRIGLAPRDARGGERVQLVEEMRQSRGVHLAVVRQTKMRSLAQEQARAEIVLELRHMAADRAVRDAELARRGGDTLVPRRRLEGAQGN